ncbi:MAG: trypsin-like peptidase domain-containing protein [Verrucomicrobia bacterium]|jgi:serine protease Do|nr:trypsin-like peptidase domain-containing protein [Verrucomicrobiota bacterium]MBT7068008.1 trypsin-like peptidase domain-containing protein [Verrucomicrobiota bacterium]MBT7698971.1 trypsin-like peptidase domain-containing protein [Verrucomicrobiota bacterium]
MTGNRLIIGLCCAAMFAAPGPAHAGSVKFENVGAIVKKFAADLGEMYEDGTPVKLDTIQDDLKKERSCKINPVPAYRKTLDADELYRKCADSIVMVGKVYKCANCDKWHTSDASGFVIGKDGIIVTNYHVLFKDTGNKAKAVAVRIRDGRILPIERILASSKTHDLAVIQVKADNLKPLAIAQGAEIGSNVYCISHPVGQLYTMTEGIVAGNFLRKEGRKDMAVTCDYAKGSSGAPLLDNTGAVVGIVRVTSPVYYEKKNGRNERLQMVWKYGIPSSSLLELTGHK